MATIKPIAGLSVHQIQSGQVIVDLCSVVKELVENSLDAGATSIEIRFKSQGLESIEVQDNGDGIASHDYETIALKHYTSKLSSYEDLSSLETFGFRGEALSSLCALSKFHIVTATEEQAPKGRRLDFESSGKLADTSVAACPKGTTVAVENLFYNLPVRRRELERNVKREYGKVLNILNAYACISTGVRFSVSSQMSKGKKAVVFSTKGNPNTKDNIANVFGAKTLLGLIPLDFKLELQSSAAQTPSVLNPHHVGPSKEIQMLGHVSRPVFGEGRQAPDRQMFFVNSRPCNLPQIAKAFNEVYKSYNLTQAPFVFADLKLDTAAYDVNVSPDKRTIMLHDQGALLESLKESLNNLFSNQEQTMPQSQLYSKQLPSFRPVTVNNRPALLAENGEGSISDEERRPLSETLQENSSLDEAASSPLEASSVSTQPIGLLEKFVSRNHRDRQDSLESTRNKEPIVNANILMAKKSTERNRHLEPNVLAEELYRTEVSSQSFPLLEQKDPEGQIVGQKESLRSSTSNDKPQRFLTNVETEDSDTSPANQALSKKHSPRSTPVAADLKNSSATTDLPPAKKRKLESIELNTDPENHFSSSRRLPNRFAAFAAPRSKSEQVSDMIDISGQHSPDLEKGQSSSEELESRNSDLGDHEQVSEHSHPASGVRPEPIDHSSADSDEEYMDEDERKRRDEARVQELVHRAEAAAADPSEKQKERAENILRKSAEKDSTVTLVTSLTLSKSEILEQSNRVQKALANSERMLKESAQTEKPIPAKASPEERLSLTVAKSDFEKMRIIGQFNLGFILTTRKSASVVKGNRHLEDLFIIDQHASDEIYNFTRLSLTTNLTPQPLVRPHQLELTAVEEETILNNSDTLAKNGFNLSVDESGDLPVGQRCHVLTLPTSRETVFDMRDLEELIALLGESNQSSSNVDIVRPSKVRKMLAMRACRSSVMVGKSVTRTGMEKLVRHMGEIDRPWNCPHGRPTMRHLAALSEWKSWEEGAGLADDEESSLEETDWVAYVNKSRRAKQADGILRGQIDVSTQAEAEIEDSYDGDDGDHTDAVDLDSE